MNNNLSGLTAVYSNEKIYTLWDFIFTSIQKNSVNDIEAAFSAECICRPDAVDALTVDQLKNRLKSALETHTFVFKIKHIIWDERISEGCIIFEYQISSRTGAIGKRVYTIGAFKYECNRIIDYSGLQKTMDEWPK